MYNISDLRNYVAGVIDESTLLSADANNQDAFDLDDTELDESTMNELLAECARDLTPMYIQAEILGESAIEALEEATADAYAQLEGYLINQGLQEATAPKVNPKLNVVHLNLQARKARYRAKMILSLARKANSNDFTKYKTYTKLKKDCFAKMEQKYGRTADRLTQQYFLKMKSSGKVVSVIESKKDAVSTAVKK